MRRISKLGLLLGMAMIGGGIALVASPTPMRIEHASQKRPLFGPRPSVEYAGTASMRFYGASLLVFGIAVCGFALYSPRR